MPEAANINMQELHEHGYNLQLWPYEQVDGLFVRVGDVGCIDRDGSFHRLFNAIVDAHHPLNAPGVPEHFEPLDCMSLQLKHGQVPAGILASKGVENREILPDPDALM